MEEAGKTTISQLLGILAGKTPISRGAELIAHDVVIHMDGHTFYGINTWATWLHYIRTRNRVTDLSVELDRMVTHSDGTITARGRWKGRQRGEEIFSSEVAARYRVVDGRVVEIWTTRSNYVFMVGPLMQTRPGHWLIMLHVYFWGKQASGPDLQAIPASLAGSSPSLNTCDESPGV
ncbi:MAG: nuclear transport factor 2 family protein [Armatimonadota bacterium]